MNSYKSYDTIVKILNVIETKNKGAYLRYGDGDFNIMTGTHDMLNSFNIKFSDELKESVNIDDKNYMKGFCLLCDKYGLLEEKMWPGNHEWPENRCVNFYNILFSIRNKPLYDLYSPVAFNYYITSYREQSYELMKNFKNLCQQNNNSVLFVGNTNVKKDILNLYFGEKYDFIECPPRNSYDKVDEIENNLIKNINKNTNYKIVIICCGVTSRCLIKRIWKNTKINVGYFLLDFGSIIDGLSGINSRQYYNETKFNVDLYNSGFKKYISLNNHI